MTEQQRSDIKQLFFNVKGNGVLDYVAGWYNLAAKYIQKRNTQVAFVSTNSITQGEQVGILWNELLNTFKIKIDFAHQTFKWSNEAKANAAVFCIIVGFSTISKVNKSLYVYDDQGEPHVVNVPKINPYLINGKDILIKSRQETLCDVPSIGIGNKPIDNGNYLFTPLEKEEFIKHETDSKKYFRRWMGGEEFLNGKERWCLYLGNTEPNELKKMPYVLKRIEAVKKFRMQSKSVSTRELAKFPTKFHVENIPVNNYIVMPEIALSRRNYFTIGFVSSDILSSNLVKIMENGTLYHFGILSCSMFMCWFKNVGGQLGNQLRFSKDIVYNNFPWPENPTDKQKEAVEKAAQLVLDARAQFPESSLADLYDPNTMPPALVKAHQQLDKVVDLCYRPQPFANETKRIEFLFELYDKYTAGLFVNEKKRGN
jgi:hypothetical protein